MLDSQPEPLTPEGVIYGLNNLHSGGFSDVEAILTLVRIIEENAKKLIISKDLGPNFDDYYYVPDESLSLEEIKRDRASFEQAAWHNEANNLLDFPDTELEKAAFILFEVNEFNRLFDSGQTAKAILSIINLVSCGLLHSHETSSTVIHQLRTRHKNYSRQGGKNKLGTQSAIKKYISNIYSTLNLENTDTSKAANKIYKKIADSLDDSSDLSAEDCFKHGEYNPIEILSAPAHGDNKNITYREKSKPEKTKHLTIERIKAIIRELNKKSE